MIILRLAVILAVCFFSCVIDFDSVCVSFIWMVQRLRVVRLHIALCYWTRIELHVQTKRERERKRPKKYWQQKRGTITTSEISYAPSADDFWYSAFTQCLSHKWQCFIFFSHIFMYSLTLSFSLTIVILNVFMLLVFCVCVCVL